MAASGTGSLVFIDGVTADKSNRMNSEVFWAILSAHLDPDGNPEHHQHLVICSLSHYQHFLNIYLESVYNFWSYLADKQTDKRWQKHHLLLLVEVITCLDCMQETASFLPQTEGGCHKVSMYVK